MNAPAQPTLPLPEYRVFDAAVPPRYAPSPLVEGVMGYLGGPRATRAWTLEDWAPFAGLRQFGIYVPDMTANPLSQARQAAQLALALGWSGKMTGARKRAIIIDLEAGADAAWYDKIATDISAHGFMPVAYGSLSTVLENAASDVLAADWNDKVAIPAGQVIHGSQYAANVAVGNTQVDYSLIDKWLLLRGGVGPRRDVP